MYLSSEQDTKDSMTVEDLQQSGPGKDLKFKSPWTCRLPTTVRFIPTVEGSATVYKMDLPPTGRDSVLTLRELLYVSQPQTVRDPAFRRSGILPPTVRDPASDIQGSCLRHSGILPPTVRDPASDSQGSCLRQPGILPPTVRDPASDNQESCLRQSGILPPKVKDPASTVRELASDRELASGSLPLTFKDLAFSLPPTVRYLASYREGMPTLQSFVSLVCSLKMLNINENMYLHQIQYVVHWLQINPLNPPCFISAKKYRV